MTVEQLPDGKFFIVALLPSQAVELASIRLREICMKQGGISAPLPPMVPIIYTYYPPPPPVPGFIPICKGSLVVGSSLDSASSGGWDVWNVDSGGWFSRLQEVLLEGQKTAILKDGFPLCRGVPIAWHDSSNLLIEGWEDYANLEESIKILKNPPHWRALNIVCYACNYTQGRPWFMSVYWQEIWKRRLRRTAVSSGNGRD